MKCVLFALALAILSANVVTAEEPAPGKQIETVLKVSGEQEVPYLFYLPKNYDPTKKHSLILFLHGRGESNGPLSLVAKWGPPRMAARGDDLNYIIVSPQCPRENRWTDDSQQSGVLAVLDHVMKNFSVDADRVYLTGLSMGGYGTWKLAAEHGHRFAAAVPVCGGGDLADAAKLKNLPMWVFHGDQDQAVPFERSVQMVDAIKAAGGSKIRFTSLEHVGHNSWSAAYATPELYGWFNKHTVSGNKQP